MATRKFRAALPAAALALGLALIAMPFGDAAAAADTALRLAQASPGGPRGAPPTAPPSAGAPQRAPAGPATEAEHQIDELQKQLAITPAQKPQFDAFAQVVRQNAQAMEAVAHQIQQSPSHNALDDLRMAARLSETQADGLKRLVPAFQALYESFSDQQKRTADQVLGSQGQGGQAAPARRKG